MTDKLLPYLVPLVFAVLILRRATQARRISPSRMWIAPTLFAVLTGLALAAEPVPGLAVIGAFVAAAFAGAGLGYLRARHQQLSIDPATGQISSQMTAVGAFILVALFMARYAVRIAFPDAAHPGHGGAVVTAIANGLLIFMVAMLITQALEIWNRTRPLLAAHAGRLGQTPPG
jgi:hypothetical protein